MKKNSFLISMAMIPFLWLFFCNDEATNKLTEKSNCSQNLISAFKSEDYHTIFAYIDSGEILISLGSADMVFDTTSTLSLDDENLLNGLIVNDSLLPLNLKDTGLSSFSKAFKEGNEIKKCNKKPCNNQNYYFLQVNYNFHDYTLYFDDINNKCKIMFFTIFPYN
jgi:hypothetical protein